ncbi:class I adenylate-forming enzyme family protein [Ruania alba]|uniref:Long-chain acyl-CoA synthetase n=1 Tax=Ruania alba TaxID=648782 RepID=A0A1H5KVP1_9MICO|nr:class I adenylate-forming enzyme family protein [Ruania alba]SEE68919.1 long-chain acyl-CoA synthetase [Ruania alba]
MTQPVAEARVTDNLAVRLLAGTAEHPDRPAILQGSEVVTYRQLTTAVRTTAARLRGLGVGPGDRVALLFGNDHRFAEALLATIWAGAVAVPLNTRAGSASLEHVMGDAAPRVLLSHDPLANRATALAAPAGVPVLLATPDRWRGDSPGEGSPSGADEPAAVHSTDICLQPYTSGSTGNPKGCLLSHGGQHWNASTVARVWELAADDRGLITAPLYHKNAMICVVKPLLLVGGTIVIGRSPDPAGIPAEVAAHRCTYTTGVPATYEMLLASEQHREHDLSSLRFVICGSAPLSDALGRRFADGLGVPVIEAYGLTEGGPQVLMNPRTDHPRYGLAGHPLPGCEVRLHDPELPTSSLAQAEQVPVGEAGELWVRNPGVTAGYHRLPEVTAERISDGWLRTGDLAVAEPDGYLRVLGRADDMMNVGGENVYPLEVEKLLRTMPGVGQAAVVPIPHERKGQVPAAFVVGEGLTEDEVKQYTLTHGAAHAHPRRVWFVDELPLGGTGKVDYARLTARAQETITEEKESS